jgi:hypothetical protein
MPLSMDQDSLALIQGLLTAIALYSVTLLVFLKTFLTAKVLIKLRVKSSGYSMSEGVL